MEELMDSFVVSEDDEVDMKIIEERNISFHELYEDLADIDEIFKEISRMVKEQEEPLSESLTNINISEKKINTGVYNLEKGKRFLKEKLIFMRDAAIIVGGGILGLPGFLLGPFVGLGTIVTGASAGIATVYGIHKVNT